MISSKSVDEYITSCGPWQAALEKLRGIMLAAGLKEEVKWGGPVYTLNGKNVAGLGAFKSYVGIWFFQGALLTDPKKLLVSGSEGVTKAQRQMRFQSSEDIHVPTVTAYIAEAMQNQKAGRAIRADLNKPLIVPEEMLAAFRQNPALQEAFDQMKLTFKREYAEYIETAKTQETKAKRLDKIIPMILEKKGLNDKYR